MHTDDFESLLNSHLHVSRDELRQQQALLPEMDHPIRGAMIRLLSNGLRTFCWIEKQRRGRSRGVHTSVDSVPPLSGSKCGQEGKLEL